MALTRVLSRIFIFVSLYFINFYFAIVHSSTTLLESVHYSNGGRWTNWERCDRGNYIIGLSLGYQMIKEGEYYSDESNSIKPSEGLTRIQLFCGEIGNQRTVRKTLDLNLKEYGQSQWTRRLFCNGPSSGFQIRRQYTPKNFKLVCSGFNETIEPQFQMQYRNEGPWSKALICGRNQALCGVQAELIDPDDSDEAIEGRTFGKFRLECCDILKPEEVCTPWDKWEVLFEYDNSFGLHPASYSYVKKVGLSLTNGITTIDESQNTYTGILKPGNEAYFKLPFETLNVLALQQKFVAELGKSMKTDFEWHTASSDTWQAERATSIAIKIDPGYRLRIYQIIGFCGDFQIRPDWIYQNGTYLETRRRGIIDSTGQRRLRYGWRFGLGIISSAIISAMNYFQF